MDCWNRRAAFNLADGDVIIIPIYFGYIGFLGSSNLSKSGYVGERREYISHTLSWNNSGQWFSVPAVKSLFLIGSYSKFWTDRGTSNVSSAANANAL